MLVAGRKMGRDTELTYRTDEGCTRMAKTSWTGGKDEKDAEEAARLRTHL